MEPTREGRLTSTLPAPASAVKPLPAAWLAHACLGLTVLVFLVLALAYARAIPPWQAPDEPAQYNYAVFLAERGELPVLQPGDYPAGRVPIGPDARLTDISSFRYESHQPPLFYALAAVVYKLHPTLLALRALSAALAAALLPVAYLCARLTSTDRPWLWAGTAAFAAFIPMHLATAGSIDNDSLADLVLSLLLLAYLAIARGWRGRWRWVAVGLLLGAALLTKVTAYLPAMALAGAALGLSLREPGSRLRSLMRASAVTGLMAAALAGWWFVRNGLVYGWHDVLVLSRQAQVARSQTHTGPLSPAVIWNFIATSFHSFWGQFGWMSVPLSEREYRLLLLLTAAILAGWAASAVRREAPAGSALPWLGLGVTWACVVVGVIDYNLTFLQPQGRYLFPALVPIALFSVAGWAALFPRRAQAAAVAALSCTLLALSVYTLQHVVTPAFR